MTGLIVERQRSGKKARNGAESQQDRCSRAIELKVSPVPPTSSVHTSESLQRLEVLPVYVADEKWDGRGSGVWVIGWGRK